MDGRMLHIMWVIAPEAAAEMDGANLPMRFKAGGSGTLVSSAENGETHDEMLAS